MEEKLKYLYEELIRRGKSRMSALYDVALVATNNKGSELSDDACNIITSEPYLKFPQR